MSDQTSGGTGDWYDVQWTRVGSQIGFQLVKRLRPHPVGWQGRTPLPGCDCGCNREGAA